MNELDIKWRLVSQVVDLVMKINASDDNHFCEMFLEPHMLEVLYYAEGVVGDESDDFVVKLNRDSFGYKIDDVINFLKKKI